MGLISTWESWGEKVGNGTRSHLVDSQTAIGKALCGLYNKYPRRLILNPYSRGFARGYCELAEEPLTNHNDSDANGGLCPELYSVAGTYKSGQREFTFYWSVYSIQGPLSGLRIIEKANGSNEPFVFLTGVNGSGNVFEVAVYRCTPEEYANDNFRPPQQFAPVLQHSDTRIESQYGNRFSVQKIVRLDGQEDLCPNEDPEFDDNDFNFEVTLNDYDINNNIVGESVYNVEINQDISPNFSGSLNFGGVEITVDVGGINIGGGSPGGGDTEDDNKPGGKTTRFLPNPDSDSGEFIVQPPPGVEEEEEVEEVEVQDEEIDWVLVTVTSPPRKGKSILFENPENNTYFAGYFAWIVTDGNAYWLEEKPIRKTRQAFKAPDNISGYRLYSVNDAKLSVRQYTQVVEGGSD